MEDSKFKNFLKNRFDLLDYIIDTDINKMSLSELQKLNKWVYDPIVNNNSVLFDNSDEKHIYMTLLAIISNSLFLMLLIMKMIY